MHVLYALNQTVVAQPGLKPSFGTGLSWAQKSEWQKLCTIQLTFGFTNTTSDLRTVALASYNGLTITTQHKGGAECEMYGCDGTRCGLRLHRGNNNYLLGQIAAADWDNLTSIEDATEDPFVKEFAFYVYTTPSHQTDKPRVRALFALKNPVEVGEDFRAINKGLMHYYKGEIDKSTNDYCRLWYGCKKPAFHRFQNVWLPNRRAEELATEYKKTLPAPVAVAHFDTPLQPGDDPGREAYLRSVVDNAYREIKEATTGDRHRVLLSKLASLQKFVNGGELPAHVLDDLEAVYPARQRGDGKLGVEYVRKTVLESKTVPDHRASETAQRLKKWGVQ